MKHFRYLLLLLCLCVLRAQAGDYPEKPSVIRPVNDFAHVLSDAQIQELDQKLISYAQSSSTEIIIITVEDLNGHDVQEYATTLGEKWQIGQKGKNNGVVVLAAMNDHKINISVGRGLEGALTDMTCGLIIDNEIKPAFRSGNYFEGFSKAADAIIAATKGEYKDTKDYYTGRHVSSWKTILAIIVILILISIFGRGRGGGGGYVSRRGYWGGMLGGSMLGGGFGGGGFGGGSSGGGFGGFGGGGSFGGGGASGSW